MRHQPERCPVHRNHIGSRHSGVSSGWVLDQRVSEI